MADPCAESLAATLKNGDFSRASLQPLRDYVECKIDQEIQWYREKKATKATVSRVLRIIIIALSTLGGLVPLIQAAGLSSIVSNIIPFAVFNGLQFGQIGYLFIALAAGAYAFDKFFGYSSGWIRYLTTMLALERSLEEFRLEWMRLIIALGRKEPTPADYEKFLDISKNVIVGVRAQIEQETQAWAAEFQKALQMLGEELSSKASKAQEESLERSQATRPGAISLTITNGHEADNGLQVQLDNNPERTEHGAKCEFVPVLPGEHAIRVTATIDGHRATASDIVTVKPGEINRTTVTLVKMKGAAK